MSDCSCRCHTRTETPSCDKKDGEAARLAEPVYAMSAGAASAGVQRG